MRTDEIWKLREGAKRSVVVLSRNPACIMHHEPQTASMPFRRKDRYRGLHNSVNTQFIFSRATWMFPQPNKADKMVPHLIDECIPSALHKQAYFHVEIVWYIISKVISHQGPKY